jgi:hypothetical protein
MKKEDYLTAFRMFLQDYESVNILLKWKQQCSDEYLWFFLEMGLLDVNLVPPPILMCNSVESFYYPPLLILFATQWALNSDSIRQARNDLAYNNGGINQKVEDAQRWIQQIQMLNQKINALADGFSKVKIDYNIRSGFGGIESPYSLLHGRFGSLIPTSLFATGGATYATQG